MIKNNRKSITKTGKKKISAGWFSLDSLMGKALCVLLVVILTVGAFVAPKLINNLYDAGTLMQITYVDIDLSPYAVSYANFEDKLQTIARAKTAGDNFLTLPAEETEQKISDAELIQAVNQEMAEIRDGMSTLFFEGWWGELTEENLVSREKNMLYMRPRTNRADNTSIQEAAPIQFWMLTFEVTESQKEKVLGDGLTDMSGYTEEEMQRREKEIQMALSTVYATDRLMVCLDADFYKLYAVAIEGDEERITNRYDWYLPEVFRILPEKTYTEYAESTYGFPEYTDLQIFMTDQIAEYWVRYWDIMPEDKNIYMDIPGELSGCVAFREDIEMTEEEDAAELFANDTYEIVGLDGSVMIAESADDAYAGAEYGGEKDILLEIGCRGSFSETDDSLWIQKTGCRHFFDIMQF